MKLRPIGAITLAITLIIGCITYRQSIAMEPQAIEVEGVFMIKTEYQAKLDALRDFLDDLECVIEGPNENESHMAQIALEVIFEWASEEGPGIVAKKFKENQEGDKS